MNRLKLAVIFLLISMQTSGILVSAYVAANYDNNSLSSAFDKSKVTASDFSSIFVVIKSSFQEQLKAITDFALSPIAFRNNPPGHESEKGNNTASNNIGSNILCFNTSNITMNVLNFTAKYQSPVGFESVFEQVFVLSCWLGFLVLFRLKKPKNYFFMLARSSIDFILGGKAYFVPCCLF